VEAIPVTILTRFDELYHKLENELNLAALPAKESLLEIVQRCSYKMFDEVDEFIDCARAKEHAQIGSATFGDVAFRVYFNSYSKRVYVDLNRDRISAIRLTLETEAEVLVDIIRSILIVDPSLDPT